MLPPGWSSPPLLGREDTGSGNIQQLTWIPGCNDDKHWKTFVQWECDWTFLFGITSKHSSTLIYYSPILLKLCLLIRGCNASVQRNVFFLSKFKIEVGICGQPTDCQNVPLIQNKLQGARWQGGKVTRWQVDEVIKWQKDKVTWFKAPSPQVQNYDLITHLQE